MTKMTAPTKNLPVESKDKRLQEVDAPVQLKHVFILIGLSLIWGSSYILMKKALVVFSSTQLATLRLAITAIAFMPFIVFRFKEIDWRYWKELLLVGLTGTAIPAFMFAIAQTKISSSVAGILNSLTPLFTLIIGIIVFKLRAGIWKVLGVIIGLIGAILLILGGNKFNIGGDVAYSGLIIIASICYATNTNIVGTYLKGFKPLTLSASSFFLVGFPAFIYLLFSGFPKFLVEEEGAWQALGYVIVLALGATVIATIIFFRVIQVTNPVFASTVSYIVPVVAVLWGLADGETISVFHFLSMGLILAGVYLSKRA